MINRSTAILALILFPLVGCHSNGQTVNRYVTALQKGDYKTVASLDYNDQQELKELKQSNPQSLWPKLVDEFYQQKASQHSSDANGRVLFPLGCKWGITEKRPKTVQLMSTGQQLQVTANYVTISYPSMQNAPMSGTNQNRLKQAILAFDVTSSGLVFAIERIDAGNAFWPIPGLTATDVQALVNAQLQPTAIHLHISLGKISPSPALPDGIADGRTWVALNIPCFAGDACGRNDQQWKQKYVDYLTRQGFIPGSYDQQDAWHHFPVIVPKTWAAYRLTGVNRQWPVGFNYGIDDHTDIQVSNVSVQNNLAQAHVKLIHSGCNLVCEFVRKTATTPQFMAYVGNGGLSFRIWGNNHWGLFGEGDSLNWPEVEEGDVHLTWDPTSLQWLLTDKDHLD